MSEKAQFYLQRLGYVLILSVLSLVFVLPFVIPIVLAATIALALYPFQLKLEKMNWSKNAAAACITGVFTFAISIPFMFFLAKGTILIIDLLERFALGEKIENQGLQKVFSVIRNDVIDGILAYFSQFPLVSFLTEEKITSYFKSANIYLLELFKNFAVSVPSLVLFFVVVILCTFSFLSGGAGVRRFFQKLFGFDDIKMDQLVVIFHRNSRQIYFSNIVTGTIQSTLIATGVYFVTHADWFLVFFVTLIFSFIPVVGAAPMGFLFSLVAFFQGNTTGAIILIVLSVFAGVVDNFLRPWLASFGESKAPAIVCFVFVIGGALLLGLPGLFIGLLVALVAYDTIPLFWDELH